MFEDLKREIRMTVINNESVMGLYTENAEKLIGYANNSNDVKVEIACLELIFEDVEKNGEPFFGMNWRVWLLEAYYDCGCIDSPEAFTLAIKIYNNRDIIEDNVFLKVLSVVYCAFMSSKNEEYINIAKNIKSEYNLINDITKVVDAGSTSQAKKGGCYVATCVYGSYDCPQVWTLRRFRDNTLAQSTLGRLFIKTYYAISPTIVKLFGNYNWFHKMWKSPLDKMVDRLKDSGVEDTPYND